MENRTTPPQQRPPDRLEDGLRDALARVVATSEALACGDVEEARGYIADLECDLSRLLGADLRPFVCGDCGLTFCWPGDLARHEAVSHLPEPTPAEREAARAAFEAVAPELRRLGLLPEEVDRAA